MAQIERQKAAKEFAEFWAGKGDEKQESQRFWIGLLHNVLGVAVAENYIEFEKRVQLSHTSYIDAYIADTKVLIEQKSAKIDLRKSYEQSDGSALTPFEQAKRYVGEMKASEKPRWIVVCNFQEFLVYDLEEPNGEPEQILLKDLPRDYYRLQFLVDQKNENIRREEEISIQAGKLVGKLYDAILPEYIRQTDASLSGQNREANMSLSSQDRDTNMSLSGQDRDTNMSLSGLTRQSIEQNDSLVKRGNDTDNGLSAEQARSLNILCVRIVFCLYAEDAGLFETRTSFEDYIKGFNLPNLRTGIINLFKALDTKNEDRDKYDETLKPFPYVNGGLFKDEQIEIPNFTQKIVDVIVNECAPFNWSEISPTIFGAVFESTLNPETRRKGGMHYTSIANIHKVIDPLFMDDLNAEFEEICGDLSLSDLTRQFADQKDSRVKRGNDTNCKRKSLSPKERAAALLEFQNKLGSLTFLDPACGSGNFLTETYLSLRRLENKVISILNKGERAIGFDEFIKVRINQFYGIEINDFAVTVAKTALWIAESQMVCETEAILSQTINFLPLTTNAFIVEGNALRMDWSTLKAIDESALPQDGLFAGFATQTDGTPHTYNYIIGNPPFVGARLMSEGQKKDVVSVFDDTKNIGNLDYVSCWYKKAAELMSATTAASGAQTKAALVSTNSITQGEQVAILWKSLFENDKVQIDFAWRTFRWDSESTEKAHVHCVIVGFSCKDCRVKPDNDNASVIPALDAGIRPKFIFDENGNAHEAKNINGYLLDAPNIFVESRQKPLRAVPEIGIGNKPIDGGNYLFTEDEKNEFVKKEPLAKKYFRKWIGSDEFINRYHRWCLWLGDCSPAEIKKMGECYKLVQAVREFRLASKSAPTQKLADTPTRFHVENFPKSDYILIPRVSSEKRRYIPIGFISPDILASDSVHIIDCSQFKSRDFSQGKTPSFSALALFGILTSSVHNAWMRAVSGRLETRYRYSKDIVYNNFPWCTPPDEQKAKIEQTAQGILDARAKYPDSSLADLYDETLMPAELRRAHRENDAAVMKAYGFDAKMSESEIVEELFKMYEKLTK